MNEMIYIGKITTTFGIKGELKVRSDFEYIDKAYKVGNKILINNVLHEVSGVRYHKNNILLKIDNIEDINEILDYVGFNIYIRRVDLNLLDKEILYKDLIGCEIRENNTCLGYVSEVLKGNNILLRVEGENNFLIPYIDNYIESIDIDKKIIITKNALELII